MLSIRFKHRQAVSVSCLKVNAIATRLEKLNFHGLLDQPSFRLITFMEETPGIVTNKIFCKLVNTKASFSWYSLLWSTITLHQEKRSQELIQSHHVGKKIGSNTLCFYCNSFERTVSCRSNWCCLKIKVF